MKLKILLTFLVFISCATPSRKVYKVPKAKPPFVLIWPMNNPKVTDYFGWRKRRMHEGIDFRAKVGDPIYASGDGKVVFAGQGLRGYGVTVLIQHAGPWSTLYAHLSRLHVRRGQVVRRGQLIGRAGMTGRTTGPHLHFELRYGADPVDPMLFMPVRIRR